MISKTLNEWKQEVEKLASIYYEMYASSINNTRCNDVMRKNYCDAAKSNWDLKEVLAHIQKYGSAISPNKCDACRRNDINHNDKLQRVYNKYQRWINQAITNGANAYIKNASIEMHKKIIDATKSSEPVPGTERIYDARNKCWRIRSQVLPTDIVGEDEFVIVNNIKYHKQSKSHRRRMAKIANAQNS